MRKRKELRKATQVYRTLFKKVLKEKNKQDKTVLMVKPETLNYNEDTLEQKVKEGAEAFYGELPIDTLKYNIYWGIKRAYNAN